MIFVFLVFTTTVAAADSFSVPKGVSALCVEAESGLVVYENNASVQRPPASMVKLMMLLLVAEGVEEGRWTLDEPIVASRHAQRMGGSQVYLMKGETHPLGHLMKAVAVASANDAAMAVAEGLWGSEAAYLARVNERAAELGMADSEFHSVHGLPPSRGEQPDRTTAHDMALLARRCLAHGLVREWVGLRQFTFRKQDGALYNTNKLLWRMEDCDGLKTGFIRAAGFCISATAERNGIRLVAVVMGHPNKYRRFDLAEAMMDQGFQRVRKTRLLARGEGVGGPVGVRNSETTSVTLTASEDLWVTALEADVKRIDLSLNTPKTIVAPVPAGTAVGEIQAVLDGKVVSAAPLVSPVDIDEPDWDWHIERGIDSRIATFASGL